MTNGYYISQFRASIILNESYLLNYIQDIEYAGLVGLKLNKLFLDFDIEKRENTITLLKCNQKFGSLRETENNRTLICWSIHQNFMNNVVVNKDLGLPVKYISKYKLYEWEL